MKIRKVTATYDIPAQIYTLYCFAARITQAIAMRMLSSWLNVHDVLRIILGRARMAMVMAKGGHFASAVAAAGLIRRRRSSVLQLSVHQPVPELVKALNAFHPVLVAPYASIAALLATEQEQGRLRINVRRQIIWRSLGLGLAEYRPRLWVDVMRRACGAASADAGWFVV